MYKTELHCHSKEVSPCSTEDVESLVEIYEKAGYSTVILTNHYSSPVYKHFGYTDINEYVDNLFDTVEKMKKVANGKFEVLLGIEIRFNENCNDYLCFGVTEEFLRSNPQVFEMSVGEFHNICRENGWLLVQAHPFRNGMCVVHPDCLDGIEVYNGHVGHHSRNFIAKEWAKEYNLLQTSGTDLHYKTVPATGGILTDEKITSISQLIETIKNGNYTLLTSDLVR